MKDLQVDNMEKKVETNVMWESKAATISGPTLFLCTEDTHIYNLITGEPIIGIEKGSTHEFAFTYDFTHYVTENAYGASVPEGSPMSHYTPITEVTDNSTDSRPLKDGEVRAKVEVSQEVEVVMAQGKLEQDHLMSIIENLQAELRNATMLLFDRHNDIIRLEIAVGRIESSDEDEAKAILDGWLVGKLKSIASVVKK